ncbi:aldo/keto reductase [Sporosarcina limicola]|uniref:Aryl-alcohol dehydrogenase-like predicted oxidoreductase n=1 Tax=Sporosarcina limicola TaxID=34101 RepID=A0A927MHV1_9BACL|nr:aldo/keto reductase [Sporosarcina limicola]MBE1554061.1 aryl-alcohol dehydrogenase-like predicted oxidoreductase [Sporosarcina limicola]
MEKREIGKSDLFVSEIGLGCMSLPDDLTEAKNIVNAAIHAGINYFDTADLYDGGKNEELVGYALRGRRDKVILATKAGNKLNPDGGGWTWDCSKKHIMNAVKNSLSRLETDYIDLYQLHGGTMKDDVFETIDAFESLKKEGLIRQYGISSIRPTVIKRFLENSSAISVMMQSNLLDRRPEEWFPMIHDAGASVITRGTIAKGFLTSEGLARVEQANGFVDYNTDELKQTVQALDEQSKDLHAAAIAFALHDKTVASALIGARTTEQLLDSIIAYEKRTPDEEINKLKKLVQSHQYKEHRL